MWYQHLVILVLLLLVGLSTQEMAQDLEEGGNVTEQRTHALDLLKFDLHHTGMPLGIVIIILTIAFLKPVFQSYKQFPASIVLLILGLIVGAVINLQKDPPKVHLKPDWFFVVLLPFIVMDAGFFLRVNDFFSNIGTISLYAIVGTLLNSALTVGLLKLCDSFYETQGIGILSYLVFGVVISAVDPVAVISVFEEIEVNERLHILVFGESLLNDGVVIVLYNSINNMLIFGEDSLNWASYGMVSVSFCVVVGGGLFMGFLFGFIGVVLQRLFVQNQALQPILAFCIPYLTYLITDTFGFSGLLAIGTCAVLMKNFCNGNVCLEMQYISDFFFKMAGSYSESAIFILLGCSVMNKEVTQIDIWFTLVAVVGTLVIRFIVIFFLTFIKNFFARRPTDVIAFRDQFIMAYGGIRGAVCYGLIASVDGRLLPEQAMFTSATLAVIIFTTVFQGFSIKWLVKYLNVERSNHHEPEQKKTVTQQVVLQSNKRVMQFLRDLTQEHEESRFYRYIRQLNRAIRKRVCYYQKPTTADMLEDQMDEEFALYAKKGTSFSGLPTDSSLINMHLPTSKSELFAAGYREDQLMPPSRPKPSIARPSHPPSEAANIPRNFSVTGIVEKAFEESENQESQKSKRRSYYNRHNLDYVAPAADPQLPDRPDDEPSDDTYQLTFPYAKNMNQKLLAATARNISKSLKNKGAHVRFVSPHRAASAYGGDQNSAHYQTYHASTSHSNQRSAPPMFTITDEESPSPPREQKKENRARPERKVTTGNKTFTIGGGEEMELLPINEDEDSH